MSFCSLYGEIVEYGSSLHLSHKDIMTLLQELDNRMRDGIIHTSTYLSQHTGNPNNSYYNCEEGDHSYYNCKEEHHSYILLQSEYQINYCILNASMVGLVKFFLQLDRLMGKESQKAKEIRLRSFRRYSYDGLFTVDESVKTDATKVISKRDYISKYEEHAFPYVYETRGIVVHFLCHQELPEGVLQEELPDDEELAREELPPGMLTWYLVFTLTVVIIEVTTYNSCAKLMRINKKSTKPVTSTTTHNSMSTVFAHDDHTSTDRILSDLADAGVISSTTVVNGQPGTEQGEVTIGAVSVLRCVMHFFRWKGGILRGIEDMLDMLVHVNAEEECPEDITHEGAVSWVRDTIRDSIITEHTRHQNLFNKVIGVDVVLAAIFHVMNSPGDDISCAYNFCDFIGGLDVKLINTTTDEVHSTLKYDTSTNMIEYWEKLEGMMVALTLYPAITYQLTINGAVVMPKYDSSLEVNNVRDLVITECKILVPDTNFTDHYVNCQKRDPRPRTTEPGYSYVGFDNQSFLDGLLLLTRTIGVQEPWVEMERALDVSSFFNKLHNAKKQ